jgi:hypothetical protein
MLSIAVEADDPALLLIAHYSLGGVLYHIGNYRTALDHLNQAYTRYDEEKHQTLAFAYGADFGVWTLSYLGLTYLVLGFPDKGWRASLDALKLASRLNHPLTLGNALIFNALSCIHRRDWSLARDFCKRSAKLAREHGFLHNLAIAETLIGLGAASSWFGQ